MDGRTVLIDPNAQPPRPLPAGKLPPLRATRWVTRGAGGPVWTMTNPGLSRRHRRVASLAFAPFNPRVLASQVILPTAALLAIGAAAGWWITTVFDNQFVNPVVIFGFMIGIAVVAAALSMMARMRQGAAQADQVLQVRGDHAQALIDIESEIATYNRTVKQTSARLPAPELLWNAAHSSRTAIAIARTLAVLPPEEDVRVLDYLHSLASDTRGAAPGNFTTLQGFVQGGDH